MGDVARCCISRSIEQNESFEIIRDEHSVFI